jgi:hypothetical protein
MKEEAGSCLRYYCAFGYAWEEEQFGDPDLPALDLDLDRGTWVRRAGLPLAPAGCCRETPFL